MQVIVSQLGWQFINTFCYNVKYSQYDKAVMDDSF